MSVPLKVLIVEDSEDDTLLLIRELRRGGYEPSYQRVDTRQDMLAALENQRWDIVIADYVMPGFSGLEALKVLKEKDIDLPFIIVSGKIGENIAIEAMKAGAHDYIMKDNRARLTAAIERELHECEIRRDRRKAEEALNKSEVFNRALFEHNPIGTIVVDLEGKITNFNLAVRQNNERLPDIGDVMYKDYAAGHGIDMYGEMMECITTGNTKEFPEQNYGDRFLSIKIATFPHGAIITHYDITERKQSEEKLKKSREELRNLAAHLQSVREEERAAVARTLHDDLGQMLTALKMDIAMIAKAVPDEQKFLISQIQSLSELTDLTLDIVKRIYKELRPAILDDLGLVSAIEWQVKEFQSRTFVKCELSLPDNELIMDKELSTAIFRISQEALTNIFRHAHATKTAISLKEKKGFLELIIKDNGKGIGKNGISDSDSFGLIGMRERAHYCRGDLKIKGIPNKGTTITVHFPYKTARE